MRSINIPLAIMLGLSVTACGNMTSNRSVNSVHQPVVTRSNYAIDLNVSRNGGLPVSEQQRLAGWFEAMELGYGDRIAVEDPTFSGGRAARDSVNALVSKYGLLVAKTAPVTEGNVPAGTVRIVVSRSSAHVPGCPNWDSKSQTDFRAGVNKNYGCATNSNLAAMIADPEDLVRGQKQGPTDQDSATKAIKAYRAGTGGK